MSGKQRIEEAWQEYKAKALDPVGAGEVQVDEARRAYYAGAGMVFSEVYGISDDSVTEDEGLDIIEGIGVELAKYLQDFIAKQL